MDGRKQSKLKSNTPPTEVHQKLIKVKTWEEIARKLRNHYKDDIDPNKIKEIVTLTLPFYIGYKHSINSETFAAIVSDCIEREYPYQIVLYVNQNDLASVSQWKAENTEALMKAGANVITADELRETKEWLEASATYDAFFNWQRIDAYHETIKTHQIGLIRDALKYIQHNNPSYYEAIVTAFKASKSELVLEGNPIEHLIKKLPLESGTLLMESVHHIRNEAKDSMVKMMRKNGNLATTPTDAAHALRINFLLYSRPLYDSIYHVIALAQQMGYEKNSIDYTKLAVHNTQRIARPSPPLTASVEIDEESPDFFNDFIQFVTTKRKPLELVIDVVLRAMVKLHPDMPLAELAKATVATLTELYNLSKEFKKASLSPIPAGYAQNTHTLFGSTNRRNSPPAAHSRILDAGDEATPTSQRPTH